MPCGSGKDDGIGYAYMRARALCRGGKMNAPRKERLVCAFVELRKHIMGSFEKVAKEWQVSVQELRRDYSCAYILPTSDGPDLLCLEQACQGVMYDLRGSIQTYAEHYYVPDDLLEQVLVSWLVSDQMGHERVPTRFLVPEAPEGSEAAPTVPAAEGQDD